jgi:hypothetical protein
MAELQADIIADATSAQKAFNEVKKSAQAAEQELLDVGDAAETVTRSTGRLTRSARQNQQAFFQLGQTISDFATAGLRGALNNIEFLAFQLGVGGPLILALSAVGVAFIAFGDDITKALQPAKEEIKRITAAMEGLVDVQSDIVSSTTLKGIEQANSALRQQEAIVANLRAQVRETRKSFLGDDGLFFGFDARVPLTGLNEVEKQLKAAEAVLEDIEKRVQGITDKEDAFTAALNNPVIALQNQWQNNADVIKALDDLYEDLNEKQKGTLNIFEKIVEKNAQLTEDVSVLRAADQDRLGALLQQNQVLAAQVKNIQEQARIASFLSGIDIRQSPGAASFEQKDEFPSEGGGLINATSELEEAILKLQPLQVASVEISKELADVIEELGFDYNNLTDAQVRIIELNLELADSVRNGLTDAFVDFFDAIGSGGDPFAALRGSIGSFMQDLGRTFIGFGIAGESIKAFSKGNPGLAIIAGAGLVALGAALKKSAESKASSFGQGGGREDAPDVPGFVDPRQGRTGRFQRNTDALLGAQGPNEYGVSIFGEFVQRGTDLVAVVDGTNRRQERTLG